MSPIHEPFSNVWLAGAVNVANHAGTLRGSYTPLTDRRSYIRHIYLRVDALTASPPGTAGVYADVDGNIVAFAACNQTSVAIVQIETAICLDHPETVNIFTFNGSAIPITFQWTLNIYEQLR